jgi:uncharacterized protein YdeI (YjbR/CyaY-like superfamily)
MSTSKVNSKADFFFKNGDKWEAEFKTLRSIILDCGLNEEVKWRVPCYTNDGKNIVLIHGFKEYCALLFFKGALMDDPAKILVQQTKNVQAARQIRFVKVSEIVKLKSTIRSYIKNAIAIEKSGKKMILKRTAEFQMADEFKEVLDENAALRKAFVALTPGRQRGYMLYFSSPKQSKTRETRIMKSISKILKGQGLND